MKTQRTTSNSAPLMSPFKATFILAILPIYFLLLGMQSSLAGSATWNLSPTSGDWNTPANWTPATVPNGPNDTATFGVSNITGLSFSHTIEVGGIVFNAGASTYTVTALNTSFGALTISGTGITNNSGSTQNFASGAFEDHDGLITFNNNATAGSLTAFTNSGGDCDFGGPASTQFFDISSAGNGTFTNNGTGCSEAAGGYTYFSGNSSAANGIFINNSGEQCTPSAFCGGQTGFDQTSTANNATLIAYGDFFESGGAILFWSDSTGGRAHVEVFDNGNLDISDHNPPGVTVGSIEGTGDVFLGANNLAVGSNNLGTTFSGVIQDGFLQHGGSLTKIGRGTLTLTGANTYTGGTTIEEGQLLVDNGTGSGLGSGSVQVNAGRLGGGGTIAGSVTVGTGSGTGATLAPGSRYDGLGTVTVQNTLTLNSDARYNCGLKTTQHTIVDKIVANGVTINGGEFVIVAHNGRALPHGAVLTVIDNTAATPIAGTFANLPDGSSLTIGNNTYQVSYEGGDGNDLTLTVQ